MSCLGGCAPIAGGTDSDTEETTTPGKKKQDPAPSRCGEQNVTLERGEPPVVLIVLDRSGSMSELASDGTATRWQQVSGAVLETVTSLAKQIRWGLVLFPTNGSVCDVLRTDAAVALDNATDISSKIEMNPSPPVLSGLAGTPTTGALEHATAYLQGLSGNAPKFIFLATDGAPSCSTAMPCPMCPAGYFSSPTHNACCPLDGTACKECPDSARAIDRVAAAASQGIETFVVGINTEDNPTATAVLNDMAIAGKRPRAATGTRYYPVTTKAELKNVMTRVAGSVVSCTLRVPTAPMRPDMVDVFLGDEKVPRAQQRDDGWEFGSKNLSLRFYGSWCEKLKTGGSAAKVRAIYTCPAVQ